MCMLGVANGETVCDVASVETVCVCLMLPVWRLCVCV